MIIRRYLHVIGLCCIGTLALMACHSGDMGASNHPAESVQGVVLAEHVLGRGAGDYFGYAVAMSGDDALVGQPHDGTRGANAGAAYIFERQGVSWQEVGKLMPDGATAGDVFGTAVALDGDFAAVGAPGANRGQGAVYVFERRDGVWRQVQRLTVSRTQPHDDFATAIALSDSALFVGAPGDSETGEQAGAIYVFARQNGFWNPNEAQKLLAYAAEPGARFGKSVALAGANALIGSPAYDGSGAAYIFERRHELWTETAQLQAREGQPGDHFGYAVAISETVAVVGAPYRGRSGAVYLVERQADGWPSIAADPLTADNRATDVRFGAAVAIAGRTVLVGASSDSAAAYGAAYLFTGRPGEAWQERYPLPQSDARRSPHFGYAVALTGPYILIGTPAILMGDNGYVYPYQNGFADVALDMVATDTPSPEPAPPVADEPGDQPEPEVNRAPRITSTPVTRAEMGHVMPEITVTDPHLDQQTITLNGRPFTPGTAITAAGSYELTVEATDKAGNTSRTTVRFAIESPDSP